VAWRACGRKKGECLWGVTRASACPGGWTDVTTQDCDGAKCCTYKGGKDWRDRCMKGEEQPDGPAARKSLKTLGEGGFGTTYLVHAGERTCSSDVPCGKYAVKVAPGQDVKTSRKEYKIMKKLGPKTDLNTGVFDVNELPEFRQGTLKEGVFCGADALFPMPLRAGGELFDEIESGRGKDGFSEADAKEIFRQLVDGVDELHEKGYVHLDLKPENILLHEKGKLRVALADYGLSAKKNSRCKTSVGTTYYVSPEMLKCGDRNAHAHGTNADYWSLGTILYILLSGSPPFDGKTDDETKKKIKAHKKMTDKFYTAGVWERVSREAKDMINGLLTADIGLRMGKKEVDEQMEKWNPAAVASLERHEEDTKHGSSSSSSSEGGSSSSSSDDSASSSTSEGDDDEVTT
jgi:serine/threonine protein kinase